MSQSSGGAARKPNRATALIVAAGLIGALLMALAMTNTLSAFVATITNSNDTGAAGALILQESGTAAGGGAMTCSSTDAGANNNNINTNASTCAGINKYGGSTSMVPTNAAGTSNLVNTTVNFQNTGTGAASSFAMAFGACSQSKNGTTNNGTATDFCSKLHVKVVSGSTGVVADTTADKLANTTVAIPASLVPAANSGAAVPFTFTTYLDNSAGDTYQGLSASQPITWTLSS